MRTPSVRSLNPLLQARQHFFDVADFLVHERIPVAAFQQVAVRQHQRGHVGEVGVILKAEPFGEVICEVGQFSGQREQLLGSVSQPERVTCLS